MPPISLQTKSFIFFFSLGLLGVFVCLMLWANLVSTPYKIYYISDRPVTKNQNNNAGNTAAQMPPIDTSTWKTYTNKEFKFSFKYKSDWKVSSPKKQGNFMVIQVDPGAKYYNIKIYVSDKEFYVLDGLPAQSETIGGAPALNVNDALYGIKANSLFYTFDVGISMSLVPEFDALVHSAQFGNF